MPRLPPLPPHFPPHFLQDASTLSMATRWPAATHAFSTTSTSSFSRRTSHESGLPTRPHFSSTLGCWACCCEVASSYAMQSSPTVVAVRRWESSNSPSPVAISAAIACTVRICYSCAMRATRGSASFRRPVTCEASICSHQILEHLPPVRLALGLVSTCT